MTGGVSINIDLTKLSAFGHRLASAAKDMPGVLAKVVQRVGPEATQAMQAVLPGQTGLGIRTIKRAVRGKGVGSRFEIKSHGGNIRLKFFHPRETRKGVTAAPWNSRRLYPATFMRSGSFPNRGGFVKAGQVVRRVGRGKYPLETVRSGLFIPEEMVTGASASAFYGTVDHELAAAVEAGLFKMF
jgi:hypothetical protein